MKKQNDSMMASIAGSFGLFYQYVRNFFDPGMEGTPYVKELQEAKITHKIPRFFARKRIMFR